MRTLDTDMSPEEIHSIWVFSAVASVFSFIGCGIIVCRTAWKLFRSRRRARKATVGGSAAVGGRGSLNFSAPLLFSVSSPSPPNNFLVFLAGACTLHASSAFLFDQTRHPTLCAVQALIRTCGDWAFLVYLTGLARSEIWKLRGKTMPSWPFHACAGVIGPIFHSLPYFSSISEDGESGWAVLGPWCWIRPDGIWGAYRMLLVALALALLVYMLWAVRLSRKLVRATMNNRLSRGGHVGAENKQERRVKQFFASYVFGFILILVPSVADRIVQQISPSADIYTLSLLHGILEYSQGTVIFLIYVRNEWISKDLVSVRSAINHQSEGESEDSWDAGPSFQHDRIVRGVAANYSSVTESQQESSYPSAYQSISGYSSPQQFGRGFESSGRTSFLPTRAMTPTVSPQNHQSYRQGYQQFHHPSDDAIAIPFRGDVDQHPYDVSGSLY